MDTILIILIILCFLTLLLINVAQRPKRTSDLKLIYRKLLKNNPSTVAFTLGWIDSRRAYKNVYALNARQHDVLIKYEKYPVSSDGKPVTISNTHGTIVSAVDGFSISGINSNVTFDCPSGYSGPECKLSALCDDDDTDAGTYKLLTRDRFKTLNLYDYAGSGVVGTRSDDESPYHKRLRVRCLDTAGNFTIEPCADNKLVDRDTVKCVAYDLCNDRLDGYKHNFYTGVGTDGDDDGKNAQLKDNQYFVCENNVSVMRECTDDTVFSSKAMGCIAKNQCFGRGNDRLRLNDESYLQCAGDTGHIKRCAHGVGLHDETPYCLIPKCVPRSYDYDDGFLRFTTGKIWCSEDGAETSRQLLCDESVTDKRLQYKWGSGDVDIRLPNWPREILDESRRQCVEPTIDDIVKPDTYIKVQWTGAMGGSYNFDVRAKLFACEPRDDLLRLDYVNQKLVPDVDITGKFVDYTIPCQTIRSPVPYFETEVFGPFAGLLNRDSELIEKYAKPFPLIYGIPIPGSVDTTEIDAVFTNPDDKTKTDDGGNPKNEPSAESGAAVACTFWPRYHEGFYYTFEYEPSTNRITYAKSTKSVIGFKPYDPKDDSEYLVYVNFNTFRPANDRKTLYVFTIDGKIDIPADRNP